MSKVGQTFKDKETGKTLYRVLILPSPSGIEDTISDGYKSLRVLSILLETVEYYPEAVDALFRENGVFPPRYYQGGVSEQTWKKLQKQPASESLVGYDRESLFIPEALMLNGLGGETTAEAAKSIRQMLIDKSIRRRERQIEALKALD